MLEIRFLGELEVVRNGASIPLPKSKKTLALLAYLILTGRRQRRDHLCSVFWETPADPRAALRWSLSKIRALVDDDHQRIIADHQGVSFEAHGADVDLLTVRRACADDLNDLSVAKLEALAARFRGQFLESVELPNCPDFTAWRVAERDDVELLQERILHTLVERLVDEPEAARSHARALARLRPDASEDPVRAGALRNSPGDDAAKSAAPDVPAADRPSIAVLPFENLSGDADQDYFAGGITEDIITELGRHRWFTVIARVSAFSHKDEPTDIRDVARDLGVQYVLEGSTRKVGDRIRVTAQLVDGATGQHVWAEHYDRDLGEVFVVQDEITRRIVAATAPEYMVAEMNRAQRKHEQNLEAWDHFMRALWHLSRFTREDMAEARRRCLLAIEREPRGSAAHGLLAIVCTMDFLYGWRGPPSEVKDEARAHAEQAIALDGSDALALRGMAQVNLYSRRHDDAISNMERAIELVPTEAENYALLGTVLALSGENDAASSHVGTALRLSPRDPFRSIWHNTLAMGACIAGEYEEAVEQARTSIRTKPDFAGGYRSLAAALGHLGRLEEAREALDALHRLLPDTSISKWRETLPFKNEAHLERYLDGLRKAGLPE